MIEKAQSEESEAKRRFGLPREPSLQLFWFRRRRAADYSVRRTAKVGAKRRKSETIGPSLIQFWQRAIICQSAPFSPISASSQHIPSLLLVFSNHYVTSVPFISLCYQKKAIKWQLGDTGVNPGSGQQRLEIWQGRKVFAELSCHVRPTLLLFRQEFSNFFRFTEQKVYERRAGSTQWNRWTRNRNNMMLPQNYFYTFGLSRKRNY